MTDPVADRDTNSSLKGFRCRKPLVSRGHLQWTMEGWVGSVLGATVWMLLFAVTLALDGRFGLACVPATAALSIGTLSRILWNRRCHVFPFTAYMILLSWIAFMNIGRARLPALQLRSSGWQQPIRRSHPNRGGRVNRGSEPHPPFSLS